LGSWGYQRFGSRAAVAQFYHVGTKGLAEREGFESTIQRSFNNLQSTAGTVRHSRASQFALMDRKWIAKGSVHKPTIGGTAQWPINVKYGIKTAQTAALMRSAGRTSASFTTRPGSPTAVVRGGLAVSRAAHRLESCRRIPPPSRSTPAKTWSVISGSPSARPVAVNWTREWRMRSDFCPAFSLRHSNKVWLKSGFLRSRLPLACAKRSPTRSWQE
jgi:hypothetical protein